MRLYGLKDTNIKGQTQLFISSPIEAKPIKKDFCPIPMAANNRKRRAEDQLSPYSADPVDPVATPEEAVDTAEKLPPRPRARREKNSNGPNEKMKGLFGKVSLAGNADIKKPGQGAKKAEGVNCSVEKQTECVISGLNSSFLKAVSKVVEKQSNRDLSYLFRQYENFLRSIKDDKEE